MKKQRSAAYPKYSIDYCLELCTKVYKNFGTYRASREQIAQTLNVSAGSLNQKLGSCVQYGLLDMKPKEGYMVTELFSIWYRPIEEFQKEESKLRAFKNPSLYENLIESFENNIVPPVKALSNILFQNHNISESACERAADIFLSNANSLELISGDGMLIFDKGHNKNEVVFETPKNQGDNDDEPKETGATTYIENSLDDTENKIITVSQNNESNRASERTNNGGTFPNQDGVIINVLLKDRRTAQIILPNDARASDFDTITNWINMMRQSFD